MTIQEAAELLRKIYPDKYVSVHQESRIHTCGEKKNWFQAYVGDINGGVQGLESDTVEQAVETFFEKKAARNTEEKEKGVPDDASKNSGND